MDRVVLTPSDGLSNAASVTDVNTATAAVGVATDNQPPPTTGHHYNHPHTEVSEISRVVVVSFCGCHVSFGANAF
jgi:hypothetical protein